MLIPTFYLSLWLVAGFLAWFSRDNAKRELTAVLFIAWVLENVWVTLLGADEAAANWIGLTDIILAAMTAFIGWHYRSRAAFAVLAAFGLREAVQVAAHVTPGHHFNPGFFLALNLLYMAQLFVDGGVSCGDLVRDRHLRGRARLNLAVAIPVARSHIGEREG